GDGVPAVAGGAADIVDRVARGGRQPGELRGDRGREGPPGLPQAPLGELGAEEVLGGARPYRGRRGGADAGAHGTDVGVQTDPEGADRDDHGVAGADLGELLRSGGRLDVDAADQLVRGERVPLHAGEEL